MLERWHFLIAFSANRPVCTGFCNYFPQFRLHAVYVGSNEVVLTMKIATKPYNKRQSTFQIKKSLFRAWITFIFHEGGIKRTESFASVIKSPVFPSGMTPLSFSHFPSHASSSQALLFSKKKPVEEEDEDNGIGSDQNEEGIITNDKIFYEDFVDLQQDVFLPKSNNLMDLYTLQARISKSKDDIVARDTRVAENWRSGCWSVRGFSLDKYDPIQQIRQESMPGETYSSRSRKRDGATIPYSDFSRTDEEKKSSPPLITVSKITLDTELGDVSSTCTSGEIEDDILIAVGRTDGSVCIVQLGNEYMTNFQAVPTVSLIPEDSSQATPSSNNDAIVKYSSKLVRAEDNMRNRFGLPTGEGTHNEGEDASYQSKSLSSSSLQNQIVPFQILYQFQAAESAISALLMEGKSIYTSGGSGDVILWELMNDDIQSTDYEEIAAIQPKAFFRGAHSKNVIAIKSLSSEELLLLTAGNDGSFAIWNRNTGDLIHTFNIMDQYNNPISIKSVDTWDDKENPGRDIVFIGLENGYIQGYTIQEILLAKTMNRKPLPSCNFLAHGTTATKYESGVTALYCAGKGTSGLLQRSTSSSTSSIILLSGGADGIVKQW